MANMHSLPYVAKASDTVQVDGLLYKPIVLNFPSYLLTYLLTYLLNPWCRVLLEKLTSLQLVKKFPAFYVTRRFITAFTSFRHPSLSWASPIPHTHNPPPADPS